jgi:hypothetical protein
MAMSGARHRRQRPEAAIQRAVVQHLRARGRPGLVFFAVENGGYRRPIEAAIMKSLGVLPGVSDLVLLHEGKTYFLELKSDNGRLSEHQQAFLASANAAGGYACAAHGLDRAIACLESWGLLIGRAQ